MKRLCFAFMLVLSACITIPSPSERRTVADALAAQHGWQAVKLPSGAFDLVSYLPAKRVPTETLTVYIEGDGLAWISGSQPSSDPTPRDPLALRLAIAQPVGIAAYLARPCQYVDAESTGCPSRYWTEQRFAPEVIASTNRAIDELKRRLSANRIALVGYSGGAAVAALVAVRRNDVERLVTVAGNLDHRAWTRYQRIHQLDGSLDPVDYLKPLQAIRQWHFVGGKDGNITPALIQEFVRRYKPGSPVEVSIEPEFDHHCCWVAAWPTLWKRIVTPRGGN